MKLFLKLLFGFIFVFMVVMTVRTSLQISLWSAIPSFAASPWSMATLYDAYFGFITFFCWRGENARLASKLYGSS